VSADGRTESVIPEVAKKLGISDQSLRNCVKQAETLSTQLLPDTTY